MPFDGDPRAAYALVHADGASSTAAWPTTTPPAPPRVRERFDGAWTETVARRIERATFAV